jgi:hypothetical protein
MKNLTITLILLAALFPPLNVRAQQAILTVTALPGATATPALTQSPSPTATATVTSSETSSPTSTGIVFASETVTPDETPAPSMTLEPTLTPTQTWPALVTPTSPATQTLDPTPGSACPTPADGMAACSLSVPATASLFGRASLDSGLNPALGSAMLIDSSGQVRVNTPINMDGTFTLTAEAGNYILRLSAPGTLTIQKTIALFAGQPVDVGTSMLTTGDINADNSIDALDLISLGAAYETIFPQLPAADLNGDGQIDLFDLTLLAKNWRKTGPVP